MSESGSDSDDGNEDVEVEETELTEGDDDVDSTEGGDGGRLLDLLVELVRVLVSESVGDELSRAFASYEAARRRLRALGVLALTVLVLLLLAAIVWLLVGVVFLADRFPSTGDPLVFAVGVAVGYALAVIAGLVYSR